MAKFKRMFPRGNQEFNTYIEEVYNYLPGNSGRLNISSANILIFNDLHDDVDLGWKVVYGLTIDDAHASKIDRTNRSACRKKIEKCMTKISNDFQTSVLNALDRQVFRMNSKKKSRKRAPKMDYPPIMTFCDMAHLKHRLAFQNPKTPKSKAMPYLNHIVLEYYIGEKGLLPKDIVFTHSMEVRRHLKSIPFSEGDVGKTVYYRCYYANTRDERSLPCAVISEVVA
ncbi:MAG: hypothetical protein WCL14_00695 [Bacteroidota bacterium]